jgi:DNA ligase-1
MPFTLKANTKAILKNPEGKTYEIENKGTSNHIISKGKFGEVPSFKKFPSAELALEKANDFITKKLQKGYKLQESPTAGPQEYLEKGKLFWKSLVVANQVKVQSGSEGSVPETNIHTFKTTEEALQKSKFLLRQQIAKGFVRMPQKFTDDFEDLKGTVLLDPLASLNAHCKEEMSENESEIIENEENENKNQVKIGNLLRRSNMVDVDEKDFPKETALKLSTMNMIQVIDEELPNGLVKSYIFDKPEVESEGTSVMTEILEEERISEVPETIDLPQKRNRSKFKTIQDMLHSIGLGRYVLNFETRKISLNQFFDLDDKSLAELGIPKRPREKILDCKISGSWEPILTNSIIMLDPQESKVTTKKSANPEIKLDPHFIVEQGTKKLPSQIDVLLAQTWDESVDPTGWWMSEKLDGVRCYWNGTKFLSRNGNPFFAPKFFIEKLPKTVSLDGELWMGRKMFQQCVGIIKRQDEKKYDMREWAKIIYIVFDAPSINKKFEDRLHYIHNLAEKIQSPYLRAHEHRKCTGLQDMLDELDKVENLGGEGLMLRQTGSLYENRRSNSLLKVKTFLDAEATVVGHKNGTGRCYGMMGALFVKGDNGIEFKIGSGFNDDQRRKPPKIGSRVTYKYQELSNSGKPRFPIFLRVHPGV